MTTIRKDVRAARPGDLFQWGAGVREVVRVRAVTIDLPWGDESDLRECMPGVEIMHRARHRAGVDYIQAPEGAQIAVYVL